MANLGIYLLKASLSMSLLYCIYWFFLRKETLFATNRVYLVSALLLSMLIPLITIHYTVSAPAENLREFISGTGLAERSGEAGNNGLKRLVSIATIIYLGGVFIFLLRILWQFILLLVIIGRSKSTWDNGIRLVENDKFLLPFSFMNMIFINPKYIRDSELSDIIAHEKVHIRENHWLDLFIVEIISIFMWFNPFIWFYERSIKQNHEYLADKGVIAQGCSVGRYHSVLINQLMGMEVIGITNNLNYSLNAKRLKMMKQKKTPKARALHILWSLPVVILLLAAFAQPEYEKSVNDTAILSKASVTLTCGVYDHNGDPIPGAIATVKGSKKGVTTNNEGVFTMKVETSDIIIVEFIGFEKSVIYMEKLVAKQGKSDTYKVKIKMTAEGKEKVKYEANSELKELEMTLKKLSLKKDELDMIKKKLSEAEKEGTIPEEELAKKKAELKKDYIATTEKMAKIKEKLKAHQK